MKLKSSSVESKGYRHARSCYLVAAGIGAMWLSGCEGYVSSTAAANVERAHQVALIEGYSEFRLLDSSADVGVAIFSYKYPDALAADQALQMAQSQIQKGDGCFRPTHRVGREVQLRCPDQPGGFWEYRLQAHGGRITAMFGDFNSPEKVSSYPDYEQAFRRAAESAQ